MLRFLTAGESHGLSEIAILEGIPAGLSITVEDIDHDMEKRRGGSGRGGRGKIESDRVTILSGIRLGKTIGSPISLFIKNHDFSNWKEIMSPKPIRKKVKNETKPRPGHADLAGALKYQTHDIRNILERASARETVMRVAVGAICRKFLKEFGIEIASHTIQIGRTKLPRNCTNSLTIVNEFVHSKGDENFRKIANVFKTDPDIRCINSAVSSKMREEIRQAMTKQDTLGGVIEIIAHNVPIGLGSHVHWDRKLDGRIAQALMSIPSVKGVEIGDAIKVSEKYGSEIQDEIYYNDKSTIKKKGFYHKTNCMGGIEGGITNGEDVICRVYHKPLSTLGKPLKTIDIKTKKTTTALVERSDICVIPRAGVVSEAMLAFVLAEAFLEKYGGDHIQETLRNFLFQEKQNQDF